MQSRDGECSVEDPLSSLLNIHPETDTQLQETTQTPYNTYCLRVWKTSRVAQVRQVGQAVSGVALLRPEKTSRNKRCLPGLWTLLSMLLLVAPGFAAGDPFTTKDNITVTAMLSGPLTLTYPHTWPLGDLTYCYWRFRPPGQPLWELILAYNNVERKRINPSIRSEGWLFTSDEPCRGEISRHKAAKEHEGEYILYIRNGQNKEYSHTMSAWVKEGSSLVYSVVVDGELKQSSNLANSAPTINLGTVEKSADDQIMQLQVNKSFPGSVKISSVVDECTQDVCNSSMNLTAAASDSREINIDIQPAVQGAQLISHRFQLDYTGAAAVVPPPPVACTECSKAAVVVPWILLAIVIILIIILLVYIELRKPDEDVKILRWKVGLSSNRPGKDEEQGLLSQSQEVQAELDKISSVVKVDSAQKGNPTDDMKYGPDIDNARPSLIDQLVTLRESIQDLKANQETKLEEREEELEKIKQQWGELATALKSEEAATAESERKLKLANKNLGDARTQNNKLNQDLEDQQKNMVALNDQIKELEENKKASEAKTRSVTKAKDDLEKIERHMKDWQDLTRTYPVLQLLVDSDKLKIKTDELKNKIYQEQLGVHHKDPRYKELEPHVITINGLQRPIMKLSDDINVHIITYVKEDLLTLVTKLARYKEELVTTLDSHPSKQSDADKERVKLENIHKEIGEDKSLRFTTVMKNGVIDNAKKNLRGAAQNTKNQWPKFQTRWDDPQRGKAAYDSEKKWWDEYEEKYRETDASEAPGTDAGGTIAEGPNGASGTTGGRAGGSGMGPPPATNFRGIPFNGRL